jgi:hypothetical protein
LLLEPEPLLELLPELVPDEGEALFVPLPEFDDPDPEFDGVLDDEPLPEEEDPSPEPLLPEEPADLLSPVPDPPDSPLPDAEPPLGAPELVPLP